MVSYSTICVHVHDYCAAMHQCTRLSLKLYTSVHGQQFSCTLVYMVNCSAVHFRTWLFVQLYTLEYILYCLAVYLCTWLDVQLYTCIYRQLFSSLNSQLRSCTLVQIVRCAAVVHCKWLAMRLYTFLVQMVSCPAVHQCTWLAIQLYTCVRG